MPSPWDLPNSGIKSSLLPCRQILYQLSHKESQRILEWVAYPLFSSSDLGIEPGSSALQVDSLPTELSGKPQAFRGFLQNSVLERNILCLPVPQAPVFFSKSSGHGQARGLRPPSALCLVPLSPSPASRRRGGMLPGEAGTSRWAGLAPAPTLGLLQGHLRAQPAWKGLGWLWRTCWGKPALQEWILAWSSTRPLRALPPGPQPRGTRRENEHQPGGWSPQPGCLPQRPYARTHDATETAEAAGMRKIPCDSGLV